jgi:heme exporter protein A
MLLRVTDLACTRGGVPVLEGVSFALDPGEVLVLRGPNGSGKTTLLRTLAGLQPPLAGRIEAAADAIAYAAHADGLKATLTVAENLPSGRGSSAPATSRRRWRPSISLGARPAGAEPVGRAEAAAGAGAAAGDGAAGLGAGRAHGLARCRERGAFRGGGAGAYCGRGAALIATHIDLGLAGARARCLGLRRGPAEAVPVSTRPSCDPRFSPATCAGDPGRRRLWPGARLLS